MIDWFPSVSKAGLGLRLQYNQSRSKRKKQMLSNSFNSGKRVCLVFPVCMWHCMYQVTLAQIYLLRLFQGPYHQNSGISNFLTSQPKSYVVGTQKNRLIETVLLNTDNTCLDRLTGR